MKYGFLQVFLWETPRTLAGRKVTELPKLRWIAKLRVSLYDISRIALQAAMTSGTEVKWIELSLLYGTPDSVDIHKVAYLALVHGYGFTHLLWRCFSQRPLASSLLSRNIQTYPLCSSLQTLSRSANVPTKDLLSPPPCPACRKQLSNHIHSAPRVCTHTYVCRAQWIYLLQLLAGTGPVYLSIHKTYVFLVVYYIHIQQCKLQFTPLI